MSSLRLKSGQKHQIPYQLKMGEIRVLSHENGRRQEREKVVTTSSRQKTAAYVRKEKPRATPREFFPLPPEEIGIHHDDRIRNMPPNRRQRMMELHHPERERELNFVKQIKHVVHHETPHIVSEMAKKIAYKKGKRGPPGPPGPVVVRNAGGGGGDVYVTEPSWIVREQYPEGRTAGSYRTPGAWQKRKFTQVEGTGDVTLVQDGAATLIRIPQGKYDIRVRAPAFNIGAHERRFQQVSGKNGGKTHFVGPYVSDYHRFAEAEGQIEVTEPFVDFAVEHMGESSQIEVGLGLGFAETLRSGTPEVYGVVHITKLK